MNKLKCIEYIPTAIFTDNSIETSINKIIY